MTRINNDAGGAESPSEDVTTAGIVQAINAHGQLLLAVQRDVNARLESNEKNLYKLTEDVQELRKQIREIISDRSLREEIGHWREHTETVLRQRDEFHRAEVDGLMDLLRTKLSVKEETTTAAGGSGAASTSSAAALAQQQQLFAAQQAQQYQMELLKQYQLAQQAQALMAGQLQQQQQQSPLFGSLLSQQQQLPKTIVPQQQPVLPKKTEQQQQPKPMPQPTAAAAATSSTSASSGWGDAFKKKAGEWDCAGCYTRCKPEQSECPCCGTQQDGSEPAKKDIFGATKPTASITPQTTTTYNFGLSTVSTATVNDVAATTVTTPSLLQSFTNVSSTAAAPSFGFTSTTVVPTKPAAAGTTPSAPQPSSTETKPALSFAKGTATATATTVATGTKPSFSFGFSTSAATASPAAASFASPAAASGSFLKKDEKPALSPFGEKSKPLGTPKAKTDEEHEGDERPEDYAVDESQLKLPQIALPDLVEARTGEEEEDVVFVSRCKLYRFDKDSKENKERGLGDIKILRHRQTGKYRCVMRREQVLKLCANFRFAPNMIVNQKGTLPAYTWACKDFSEDTINGEDETLTARFKEQKTADEFRDKFREAVAASGGTGTPGSSPEKPPTAPTATTATPKAETTKPLFSFATAATATPTTAGGTPVAAKPAFSFTTPKSSTTTAAATTPAASFSFTPPVATGNSAAATPTTATTPSTFGGGSGATAFGSFKFAAPSAGATPTTAAAPPQPAAGASSFSFSFKPGAGAPSFASVAASNSSFLNKGAAAAGPTAAADKPAAPSGFGEKAKPFQAAQKAKGKKEEDGEEHEGDERPEDYAVDESQLKLPQIALPDLVEAKTGEEDEEVVFVSRCKLYRFDKDSKEQKERGLGDIKILRHRQTGKYRCVMRREQVHKLAANFPFTALMTIGPRVGFPAYQWACKDFSEDTVGGADEIFTARFKEQKTADEFAAQFRSAVQHCDGGAAPPTSSTSAAAASKKSEPPRVGFRQPQQPPKEEEDLRADEEDQEYAQETGGYDDEVENEDEEEEDEEHFDDDMEVILDAECEATFDEGYVSPLKAASSNPAASVKCRLYVGYTHDRYRVWYEDEDPSLEPSIPAPLFVHFIYRQTQFTRTNATAVEYAAPHADTGVQKRVRLRFASADEAKRVLDAFVEGVQMAEDNQIDEEEDFA